MILYLDTSALVKRYFREPYTNDILSKWKLANHIVTSAVAYAETMATIYRKKREANLEVVVIRKIIESFTRDWLGFIRVEVNDDLNEYISNLVEKYALKGFDAIHLASAMIIHERLPRELVFACFDKALLRAAQSEGMKTYPPENTIR